MQLTCRTCFVLLFFLPLALHAQRNLSKNALPQLGKDPIPEVIKAMTPEEKVSLLMGTGMNMPGLPENMRGPVVGEITAGVAGAAGTTFPVSRLGIPAIVLADGPAGLRIAPRRASDSLRTFYCTAFPIGTLLSSSWDTALVKAVGMAMGKEAKEYGVDILLAPALNIQRNPLGGRNFEYYSEDPFVAGMITKAMVRGIESNGVGTSIKHFAANNNEVNRNTIDVRLSERALREIYLKGFEMTVRETQPWTVMSSYNKINGTYTSESYPLLTTILRDEWGFKGLVMTDWFGGTDAIAQMKAGNELLMPGTGLQQKKLLEALRSNALPATIVDRNLEVLLRLIVKTPSFKKYRFSNRPALQQNALVARKAAADGMVLLENRSGVLPLAPKGKRVAVFGNASYDMVTGGTGSGDVNEAYSISLTDGLKAKGFLFDTAFGARYKQTIEAEKGKRPKMANPFLLPPPILETIIPVSDIQSLAAAADVAIITIGRNSGEFADRTLEGDFYLGMREKDLLRNVTKAFHDQNKKVVVILNVGGVIEMASWKDSVDAVLLAWQPGQEAGNAIVDILTGAVNPSGKLPVTFPVRYEDVSSAKNFPGAADNPKEVVYEEGIYVGYRHADKFKTAPVYPFGFGLSYTSFAYSNLKASVMGDRLMVSVDVRNSGSKAGKEVVQIYVGAPQTIDKPEKELRAFGKTALLQPGARETLRFSVPLADLASFHSSDAAWITDAGTYTVFAAASSQDVRQQAEVQQPRAIRRPVKARMAPQVQVTELK